MPKLAPIPDDGKADSSVELLRQGYLFLPRRWERFGTDAVRVRLGLRRATCLRGADAAEMFYDGGNFTRRGAIPPTVLRLLQDKGSAGTLDGAAHHHRKAMFLALADPNAADHLAEIAQAEWARRLPHWERAAQVNLFDETRAILLRAVCAWAGVPLRKEEVTPRLRELSEMIEATGSVGPRNWRAMLLRSRTEHWARGLIRETRKGFSTAEGTALGTVAWHRDREGQLLPVKVAAVELLNVLRPVVATARFLVFAALALHNHPDAARRIREGDEAFLRSFAQEVRRRTPFFPFVGGKALRDFDWRGHRFAKGDWVILDLFGTCHDPRLWDDPMAFRPDRFLTREPTPYDLIPQGAGDHLTGHRCPGEWISLALIRMAARQLADLRYEVPPQDLGVDLTRIPGLPRSGFVLTRVGRRAKEQSSGNLSS